MTALAWVAAGVLAWIAVALPAGIRIGRRLAAAEVLAEQRHGDGVHNYNAAID